jgi:hypothetical protein
VAAKRDRENIALLSLVVDDEDGMRVLAHDALRSAVTMRSSLGTARRLLISCAVQGASIFY